MYIIADEAFYIVRYLKHLGLFNTALALLLESQIDDVWLCGPSTAVSALRRAVFLGKWQTVHQLVATFQDGNLERIVETYKLLEFSIGSGQRYVPPCTISKHATYDIVDPRLIKRVYSKDKHGQTNLISELRLQCFEKLASSIRGQVPVDCQEHKYIQAVSQEAVTNRLKNFLGVSFSHGMTGDIEGESSLYLDRRDGQHSPLARSCHLGSLSQYMEDGSKGEWKDCYLQDDHFLNQAADKVISEPCNIKKSNPLVMSVHWSKSTPKAAGEPNGRVQYTIAKSTTKDSSTSMSSVCTIVRSTQTDQEDKYASTSTQTVILASTDAFVQVTPSLSETCMQTEKQLLETTGVNTEAMSVHSLSTQTDLHVSMSPIQSHLKCMSFARQSKEDVPELPNDTKSNQSEEQYQPAQNAVEHCINNDPSYANLQESNIPLASITAQLHEPHAVRAINIFQTPCITDSTRIAMGTNSRAFRILDLSLQANQPHPNHLVDGATTQRPLVPVLWESHRYHTSPIYSTASFQTNHHQVLATGSQNSSIKVAVYREDSQGSSVHDICEINSHMGKCRGLTFTSSNTLWSTCSGDFTLRSWKTDSIVKGLTSCHAQLGGHDDEIQALISLPSDSKAHTSGTHISNTMLSTALDGTIRLWDSRSRICQQVICRQRREHASLSLASNPLDPKVFASGHQHGVVCLWDLRQVGTSARQQCIDSSQVGSHSVRDLSSSPDGQWLSVAALPSPLQLVHCVRGKMQTPQTLPTIPTYSTLAARWHPSIPCLVTCTSVNTLDVWRLDQR